MDKVLEELAKDYCFYFARHKKYCTGKNLPFKKSPEVLLLTERQQSDIIVLGPVLAEFLALIGRLYGTNKIVTEILNISKPPFFTEQIREPNYLFFRPDLLLTNNGFKICEIETSLFGLGLAEFLNSTYEHFGFTTLVDSRSLKMYIRRVLPKTGILIFSEKTQAYKEQLVFLADTVFSEKKGDWRVVCITDPDIFAKIDTAEAVYRCFYLGEYMDDPLVFKVLHYLKEKYTGKVYPSLTPHMEEKAIMGLLWDKGLDALFQRELGADKVSFLRRFVPPTWNFGKGIFCLISLPTYSIKEFAVLPRRMKRYVLKISGFGSGSSWAEGVFFLHKKSQKDIEKLLLLAEADQEKQYVLQEFVPAKKVPLKYFDENSKVCEMQAKLRITPYYSFNDGKLLTIKVTGCENTDLIHASTASINTAVGLPEGW